MTASDSSSPPALSDVEQLLQEAVVHHQAGRLQDAERIYRAILEVRPNHSDANHDLGVLAMQVGKPEAALEKLKAAVDANPNIEQYWLSYAEAFLRANRVAAARIVRDQAMERGFSGEKFDALTNKVLLASARSAEDPLAPAVAHLVAGRKEETEKWLADYVRRCPNDAHALASLGEILRHQPTRLDEALSLLARSVEIDANLATAWLSYGAALQQAKRYADAKEAFGRVLSLEPNRVDALNNLGVILVEEKNWSEAVAAFEKACAIDSNNARLLLNYAIALENSNRRDEAIRVARQAQTLDRENRLDVGTFLAELNAESSR